MAALVGAAVLAGCAAPADLDGEALSVARDPGAAPAPKRPIGGGLQVRRRLGASAVRRVVIWSSDGFVEATHITSS